MIRVCMLLATYVCMILMLFSSSIYTVCRIQLMMYECMLLAIILSYVYLCYFLAAAIQMWSAIFVSHGNLKPFSLSAVEFGSQDTTKTKGPRTHKESLIFTLHFILQNLVLSVSVECIYVRMYVVRLKLFFFPIQDSYYICLHSVTLSLITCLFVTLVFKWSVYDSLHVLCEHTDHVSNRDFGLRNFQLMSGKSFRIEERLKTQSGEENSSSRSR